ncbi:hypothetical protein BDK51DRAFT_40012 [Blyttiomyces helicus]|uniref:DUF1748-domain-containing protein n=1 Tax=Blyttiomyces helicus TaxID=388810 RepID=A0A4P9WBK1_9FUNG|nr:hypothetical protein BDK51DRAFT_40012 [Blyttiomyces helicus]|eukprot:RKO89864.1 hypothetical protein BDK51DRAFT_40012 [Blyttiomyces helicus]
MVPGVPEVWRVLLVDGFLVLAGLGGLALNAGREFNYKKVENETARSALEKYFWVGDVMVDQGAAILKTHTDWFPANK